MELHEYLAHAMRDKIPAWYRRGQHAFNLLCEKRPDLSEQIRATNLDPFHKDTIPDNFVQWVTDHWNDPHE